MGWGGWELTSDSKWVGGVGADLGLKVGWGVGAD